MTIGLPLLSPKQDIQNYEAYTDKKLEAFKVFMADSLASIGDFVKNELNNLDAQGEKLAADVKSDNATACDKAAQDNIKKIIDDASKYISEL